MKFDSPATNNPIDQHDVADSEAGIEAACRIGHDQTAGSESGGSADYLDDLLESRAFIVVPSPDRHEYSFLSLQQTDTSRMPCCQRAATLFEHCELALVEAACQAGAENHQGRDRIDRVPLHGVAHPPRFLVMIADTGHWLSGLIRLRSGSRCV